MLRHYLTTAWRYFRRNQTFSFINLLGLSIGMAACLLILQYVRYERGYDNFHEEKDNLYRVAQKRFDKGELSTEWAAGCGAIGPALKAEFPEVKAASTVRSLGGTMRYKDNFFRERNMYMVMPDFFKMFTFEVVEGNPEEQFTEPFQAAVSRSTAKRYFGSEDPIGKTITHNGENDFTVVAIFEDIPEQSHMKFDLLFSYQTFISWQGEQVLTAWQWDGFYTYVLLQEGTDQAAFEAKIPALVETQAGERLKEFDAWMSFYLQPVDEIHLTSDLMYEMEANGNGQYVYFLSLIAIFILGIAWVNYINLATAKSTERAKEVGLRKVMGSFRSSLMRQFLVEALLTNTIAAAIAIILARLALPVFNNLTESSFRFEMFSSPGFWALFLAVLLGGSLLSGLYPAFVLSSFKPVSVLKGRYVSSRNGILLRKFLVGFQFAISLLLIAGTITVYRQLAFMRTQDLGVNIDQTLVMRSPDVRDSTYADKLRAFKSELILSADIKGVTASSAVPGRQPGWNAGGIRRIGEGPDQAKQYRVIGADYDYIDAYEIELIEGRSFDESFGTDESKVLFNESAIKVMGFQTNKEALGVDIYFWGDTFEIVGVLADYHHQSLKVTPEPLIFRLFPSPGGFYSAKIQSDDAQSFQSAVAHVESTWAQFFPATPVDYFFLDTYFDDQYRNDRTFGAAFAAFALLAIIVACLGLFGLTAYAALQRTKEVGIRKVLGASGGQIVQLLSREIIWLVVVAAFIALPLSWFLMQTWLESYAYRIDLDWQLFAWPLLGLLAITLGTVSFQIIRTARLNPVKALRYE